MPHPASPLATDQIPARPAEPLLVPLAGEWAQDLTSQEFESSILRHL